MHGAVSLHVVLHPVASVALAILPGVSALAIVEAIHPLTHILVALVLTTTTHEDAMPVGQALFEVAAVYPAISVPHLDTKAMRLVILDIPLT